MELPQLKTSIHWKLLFLEEKIKRIESQLITETYLQHKTSVLWARSGHGEGSAASSKLWLEWVTTDGLAMWAAQSGIEAKHPTVFS